MNSDEDQRTASGLALVDFRLGLIETNIDSLSKKFDGAMERLPTVDTISLILEPYSERIKGVQEDVKDLHRDVERLEKLEPTVKQLKAIEDNRADTTRQVKLIIAGAILSPIIAVIISAITVYFTVSGGSQ